MSTILTLFFALLLVAPKAQPQPSPTDELFSRTHVLRPLAEGFAVAGTTGGLAVYSVSGTGETALVGRLVLPSAVRDLLGVAAPELLPTGTPTRYAVTLTVAVEADSADQAAEAFGFHLSDTATPTVTVTNLDTGESTEVDL